MFVLDFLPEQYLNGGPAKSIAVFTAGWAMKFVPLLGKSLMQLVVKGESEYALPQFSIDRVDPATGKPIIQPGGVSLQGNSLADRTAKATRSRGSQS
jgi:sarcosine oxidase/L-pipecolate oxidase